jgi:hypothetical protein
VYRLQGELELAITAKIQAWQYVRQYEKESDLYQAHQKNSQRHILKAQQWLQRAMLLALRLDRQVNSTDRQTLIHSLQEECAALLATESET